MSQSASEFLAQLAGLDVRLWLDDGKLRCDAPRDVLTPEVVESLKRHKQDIIAMLTRPLAARADVFDPQDPAFAQDPYPSYDRLRADSPVYRSPQGHWVLTRYDDVRAALLNPVLANMPAPHSWLHASRAGASLGAEVANNILPFMDGAHHAQRRRLIASTFSAHLRSAAPDLEAIARRLLAPLPPTGQIDLVRDFGRPYATLAICELLGLPPEDHVRIAEWGDSFLYLLTGVSSEEQRAAVEGSLAVFREYCIAALEQRRTRPGNDLISALLAAGDEANRLPDLEIVDTCMLLVADGVENVASLVGSSVVLLLERAGAQKDMALHPECLAGIATECLRYETPGQYIARVATQDTEIAGQAIRKNESVLLVLGAANRDPQVYTDPGTFDAGRDAPRHLSFGRGRHTCLGAQLVPLELEVALRVLFESLPGMRVTVAADPWLVRPGHRWLRECTVTFGIAGTTNGS